MQSNRGPNDTLGAKIGDWRLGEVVGQGATATVWSGRNDRSGARAAVKILHPSVAELESARRSFSIELRRLKELDGDGFPALLDSGEENGVPWAALELLEGGALRDRIPEGGIPWEEAARTTQRIARILTRLHARGLVHRDLKPENLLFGSDGLIRLADLGVAAASGSTGNSSVGAGAGTPAYMAPEQLLGDEVGPSADLYALGGILFEMLWGRHPWQGLESDAELIAAHLNRLPPVLPMPDGAPEAIRDVALVCLAKRVDGRYADAAEVEADIAAVLGPERHAPIAARRLGGHRTTGRLHGRGELLRRVSRWFDEGPSGKNRLLLVRGVPGSGKTALVNLVESGGRQRGLRVGRLPDVERSPAEYDLLVRDDGSSFRPDGFRGRIAAAVPEIHEAAERARVLEVEPLRIGAIASWTRSRIGVGTVPRRDLRFLLEATGGLPGRIDPLLLRWAKRLREEPRAAGRPASEVLETTAEQRARLRDQLSVLPTEARLILEVAAWCHPAPIAVRDLADQVGLPGREADAHLGRALASGIPVNLEDGELRFFDGTIADSFRRQTEAEMKADLVDCALAALSGKGGAVDFERRGELLLEVGRAADAGQMFWCGAASWDAAGDSDGTIRCVERGLGEAARVDSDQVPLVGRAAAKLAQGGRSDEGVRLLERLRRLAPDALILSADLEEAVFLLHQGDFGRAGRLLLSVAGRSRREGRTVEWFRAVSNLATLETWRGRLPRAERLHGALSGFYGAVLDRIVVSTIVNRADLAVAMGKLVSACELLEIARPLARKLGNSTLESQIEQIEVERLRLVGDLSAALAASQTLIRISNRSARPYFQAWARGEHGQLLLQAGDVSGARTHLRAAVRLAIRCGQKDFVASYYEFLAHTSIHLGDRREASRFLALMESHQEGHPTLDASRVLLQADLVALEGDLAEARRFLGTVDRSSPSLSEETRLHASIVEVLAGAARPSEGEWAGCLAALERSFLRFRSSEFRERAAVGCAARVAPTGS